ncbi:unnamed protein product [Moneuplotes crassus]|uniref:Uncharacterized protein n=1 Tax=Euplotes crassus TaxID=5936 RepID=A0AAD1Y356_EUPCR|nr:unnamed protein product [Moneuplotes crassus]
MLSLPLVLVALLVEELRHPPQEEAMLSSRQLCDLSKDSLKMSSSLRIPKLLEEGILTEICKKSNPRCKYYFVSSFLKKKSQKSLWTTPLVLLIPSGDQDLIEVKKLKKKFRSSIHVVRHFQRRNSVLSLNLKISEFSVAIRPRNWMILVLESSSKSLSKVQLNRGRTGSIH